MSLADKVIVLHLYQKVSNEQMRLKFCEYCGITAVYFETHHIRTKGAGGPDIRANKINLCFDCHRKAQDMIIKPWELIVKVARREAVPVEAVYVAIEWPVPDNIKELEKMSLAEDGTPRSKSVEEYLNMLIMTEEKNDELRFLRGEIIDILLSLGFTKSWIAAQIGKSTGYVRKHWITYKAFPDENSRVPVLSWQHHYIAATTEDPVKTIKEAEEKKMSTRQLSRAVKGLPPEKELKNWQEKAEKALNDVQSVLDAGGVPAAWLLKELQKIVELNSRKEAV